MIKSTITFFISIIEPTYAIIGDYWFDLSENMLMTKINSNDFKRPDRWCYTYDWEAVDGIPVTYLKAM